MKKFLVIYRMDSAEMKKMMETSSKEDQQKGMMEWGEWIKANAALFADQGGPVGKNWQVTASGTALASNDVGGYSIVQAESAEAAAAAMASGPHMKLSGATCDVMEIMSM